MDIIYIDPGYGKGLTTLLGSGTSCIESDEYNPVNDVAFTGNNCTVIFPIPTSFYPTSTDSFVKGISYRFSAYFDLKDSALFTAGFGRPHETASNGVAGYSNVTFSPQSCSSRPYGAALTTLSNVSTNGWHNVAISFCIYDNGTSSCSVKSYTDVDGNVLSGEATTKVDTLQSSFINLLYFSFRNMETSTCYVSNVIVATATGTTDPILTSQTLLVKLPLSTPPDGDFLSVGDGEYVGNTSGQKLLQTINASEAIEKYGASSKVSHLGVVGKLKVNNRRSK